jgi:hypothetical protein
VPFAGTCQALRLIAPLCNRTAASDWMRPFSFFSYRPANRLQAGQPPHRPQAGGLLHRDGDGVQGAGPLQNQMGPVNLVFMAIDACYPNKAFNQSTKERANNSL